MSSTLNYRAGLPPEANGGRWTLVPRAAYTVPRLGTGVHFAETGVIAADGTLLNADGTGPPSITVPVLGDPSAGTGVLQLEYRRGATYDTGLSIVFPLQESSTGVVDVAQLAAIGRPVVLTLQEQANIQTIVAQLHDQATSSATAISQLEDALDVSALQAVLLAQETLNAQSAIAGIAAQVATQVNPAVTLALSAADQALASVGINPAFVSETATDPPLSAPTGTKGARVGLGGLWQRLIKAADNSWQTLGSPLMSLLGMQLRVGISVLDYGATGNGSTDDRAAILLAVAAAQAVLASGKKPVLNFPAATGYATTGNIKVPKGIHVRMDAPLIYTGAANEDILTIGMSSAEADANGTSYANSSNDGMQMKLWAIRQTVSDWLSEASVSIRLVNMNRSRVQVVDVSNSTIGLLMHGDRWGCAYNQVHLGILGQNKVGLDLLSDGVNGTIQGYANENTFYGGHFTNSSSLGARSRAGVRLRWAGVLYPTNNNRFFSPTFELKEKSLTGGATAYAFEAIDAQNNISFAGRHEGGVTSTSARYTHAKESGVAGNNRWRISYSDRGCILDDSAALYRTSRLEQLGVFSFLNTNEPLIAFNSGRISDYASTSGGFVGFGGLLHTVDSSGNISNQGAVASYTVGSGYVTSAGFVALGVYVNTTNTKKLTVRKDVMPGATSNGTPGFGRIYIKPFDAAGNPLDGSSTAYVSGESAGSFLWTAAWGGAFALQSDGYWPSVPFSVTSAVATAQVMIGLNKTQLRSFQVLASENVGTTVWSGVTAPAGGAAPTPERVWDSGFLAHRTAAYDATRYHIQTHSFFNYTTGAVSLVGTGITVYTDHIEIDNSGSSFNGVWVDTSVVKRLIINRTVLNSRGGRLRVAAVDSVGTRLTGGADVTGTTALTWSAVTNTYAETVDTTAANTITVGSSVDRVYLMLCGGSNPIQLVSWNIEAYGTGVRVWTGVEALVPDVGRNYAIQAPVNGTYIAGREVDNLLRSAGGKVGWTCTTAGTPGTWKAYGAIDA